MLHSARSLQCRLSVFKVGSNSKIYSLGMNCGPTQVELGGFINQSPYLTYAVALVAARGSGFTLA